MTKYQGWLAKYLLKVIRPVFNGASYEYRINDQHIIITSISTPYKMQVYATDNENINGSLAAEMIDLLQGYAGQNVDFSQLLHSPAVVTTEPFPDLKGGSTVILESDAILILVPQILS